MAFLRQRRALIDVRHTWVCRANRGLDSECGCGAIEARRELDALAPGKSEF